MPFLPPWHYLRIGRDMLPEVGQHGVIWGRIPVMLPGFQAHPGGDAAVGDWPPGGAYWWVWFPAVR
jgi:hypothetical protein